MNLFAFSVYDNAIKAYGRPWFARNEAEALRSFRLEVANPDSFMAKSPADFTLFMVGSFDDNTGELRATGALVNLGTALQHLPPKEVD